MGGGALSGPGAIRYRRPVEADHAFVVSRVDAWWGGRRLHDLLPRLWFQHFTGTSWIAEARDGRSVGFLVGFVWPDHPDVGYVHMIATDPGLRRQGVGRELYQRFFEDVAARGVRTVQAITWPGNRVSIEFHRAMGFSPAMGPGTVPAWGSPAFLDYDAPDEDRTVFELHLDEAGRPTSASGEPAEG